VYNIADIGVSVGAAVLVLSLLIERETATGAETEATRAVAPEHGVEGDPDGAND
jgi:hypothetical protein